VVLTLCAWILEHFVARALSLGSPVAVVPIVAAAGFWLALSIDRGLIQSRRAYKALAANLLVEGGVRMAFVLILTGAGFGVAGACGGILIGEASAAGHALWLSNRKWAGHGEPAETGEVVQARVVTEGMTSRRHLALDVSVAFGCLAFLALLQNLDVILLGREDPKLSGEYAAISVAAKALVFGAIALGGYLLPEATIRWHRGEHALRPLATTAIILAIPAVVLAALAVAVPRFLLRTAFGPRLVGAAGSLKVLVFAMALLCATVLLTNYLLGTGRRWVVFVLAAGTAAAAVAIYEAHGVPSRTARADLFAQAAIAVVVGIGFVAAHRNPGQGYSPIPPGLVEQGSGGPEGRP
jgi:O-antigen/teichoic acid export membrane protein